MLFYLGCPDLYPYPKGFGLAFGLKKEKKSQFSS